MNILVIVIIIIVILVIGLIIILTSLGMKKKKLPDVMGGDIFSEEEMSILDAALKEISEEDNIIEGGASKKPDPNKPAIILFNGFCSSKLFWEYAYEGSSTLRELNFLKKLKRVGDIYTFNLPFFNINYYSRPKESKIWNDINNKYKPYDSELDFTLEDLDYMNICKKVHEDVKAKFGPNKKCIIVGSSYGGPLALLYSKLYKSECKLCVCIDNSPYVIQFYNKYNERKNKSIVTKINTDKKLTKLLNIIKTSSNIAEINEASDKVMTLISRLSALDRIKYYDPKLYVPTIFFKAIKTNPTSDEKIRTRFNRKEKRLFASDPNMKLYKFCKDADHHIWNNQKYSDAIVRSIKKFYQ
jgi:pimeloyl-ACP methyl ester carboxylesterase